MKKICLLFGILLLIFNLGLFNLVLAESNLLYNGEPTNEKYTSPDYDLWAPYMRELQRQIRSNWVPPKFDFSARVILVFTIEKDGRLSKSAVYKSSGVAAADEAAIEALKKAAPFKPLPAEFKGNSIDIQFTFDYNVFGKNNSSRNTSELLHSAAMGEDLQKSRQPYTYTYYENLDNTLSIVKRSLIREKDGYKYTHAMKVMPLSSNAYLWRCRIDCKNRKIGVRKTFEGSVQNTPMHLLGFTQLVNVFTDEIKMHSPEKNQDYLKIYNYVCQP